MKYYNELRSVPEDMTKKITGGRLNGMTDIKPQWRYMRFSEVFGDCGTGWYYNIEKLWTENGSEGQVVVFAKIELFYKDGDKWSHPVAGIGGSTLVAKERAGLFTNDEAYKMAVTDALSVAMKMVGVAADIYMGYPPQTKYSTRGTENATDDKKDKTDTNTPEKAKSILEEELERFIADFEKMGFKYSAVEKSVIKSYKHTIKEMTMDEIKEVRQIMNMEK